MTTRSIIVTKAFQGFIGLNLWDGSYWDGVSAVTAEQQRVYDKNFRRRFLTKNWLQLDVGTGYSESIVSNNSVDAQSGKPTVGNTWMDTVYLEWKRYGWCLRIDEPGAEGEFMTSTSTTTLTLLSATGSRQADTENTPPDWPYADVTFTLTLDGENDITGAVYQAKTVIDSLNISDVVTGSGEHVTWDATWALMIPSSGVEASSFNEAYIGEGPGPYNIDVLGASWGDGLLTDLTNWQGLDFPGMDYSGVWYWNTVWNDPPRVIAVKSQFTGLEGPYWFATGYLTAQVLGPMNPAYRVDFSPISIVFGGNAHADNIIDIPMPSDISLTDSPIGQPLYCAKVVVVMC